MMVNFTHGYDKRNYFDFPVVNFPYLSSNIPESPSCVVLSQSILNARVKMLTLSGTHDFTPFGEFMISPIHYMYTICQA